MGVETFITCHNKRTSHREAAASFTELAQLSNPWVSHLPRADHRAHANRDSDNAHRLIILGQLGDQLRVRQRDLAARSPRRGRLTARVGLRLPIASASGAPTAPWLGSPDSELPAAGCASAPSPRTLPAPARFRATLLPR